MKFEKLLSALVAAVFAVCIACGGVGCLTSGFELQDFSWEKILVFSLAFSLFSAVCISYRWGIWVLDGVLALGIGFLLRDGDLVKSAGELVYHISVTFDKAYGCGILGSPGFTGMTMALCGIAGIVILVTVWTLCWRKNCFFVILTGLLPVALCFVVVDTVPDSKSLIWVLAALLLLLLSQSGRRRGYADGLRQTVFLLIPAILFTQILFWAIPKETYRAPEDRPNLWQDLFPDNNQKEETEDGLPDAYDLEKLGPRVFRNVKVMEVTSDRSGILYLRGQAYDRYDGKQWLVAPLVDSGWPAVVEDSGTVQIKTGTKLDYRYFPYYPDLSDREIVNGQLKNVDGDQSYSYPLTMDFTSVFGEEDVQLDETVREQCLQLPQETRESLLKYLREWIPKGEATAEQKAQIIAGKVRELAKYDLNTGKMPADQTDFALWFLESGETGYCVHFATAATVLLRGAGIPARYVTGYIRPVEAGESASVLDSNAHAWVEYFSEKGGWKRLDPTPAAEGQPDPQPTEPMPTESLPTETTQSQTEVTQPVSNAPARSDGGSWVLWLGLAVAAAPAILFGQYGLRRWFRKRRLQNLGKNRRAVAYWQEACRYGKILKRTPPEELLALAEKARFSQHTLTDEELDEFCRYLRDGPAALKRKNLCYRWVSRLIWAVK